MTLARIKHPTFPHIRHVRAGQGTDVSHTSVARAGHVFRFFMWLTPARARVLPMPFHSAIARAGHANSYSTVKQRPRGRKTFAAEPGMA